MTTLAEKSKAVTVTDPKTDASARENWLPHVLVFCSVLHSLATLLPA